MSVEYVVRVLRLAWGDHGPRLVGDARSSGEHLEMVRKDLQERFGDDQGRLWVYSFIVLEIDEETDSGSLIREEIAYGRDLESVEKAIDEIWNN